MSAIEQEPRRLGHVEKDAQGIGNAQEHEHGSQLSPREEHPGSVGRDGARVPHDAGQDAGRLPLQR